MFMVFVLPLPLRKLVSLLGTYVNDALAVKRNGKGKGKTKTISKSKKAALEEAGIKVKPTSKRKTTGKRKATRAQATA